MPKRKRRFACLALGCLGAIIGGLLLAGGVAFALSSTEGLGPADASLDLPQRAALAAYLTLRAPDLNAPGGTPGDSVTLDVQPGMTASQVVDTLEAQGMVRDGQLLSLYLRYRGLDRGVQAGRYQIEGSMSLRQIAETLQSASAQAIQVTIPEGWRREQIASALAQSQLAINPDSFLRATQLAPNGFSFSSQIPAGGSVEGFLFPDTYLFEPGTNTVEAAQAMLQNFDQRVTPEMRSGFEAQGLTLFQAVTLASIVEREAVVPDERPKIASVFLNRLSQGLKLDADPTVQYAVGHQPDGSWWKTTLTSSDLSLDNPYNTYVYAGLPPGPICNPGLASLKAVAQPADTPYLYFRAACDGSGRHQFAETYGQHLQNACP
jgi:UPF0755 protein